MHIDKDVAGGPRGKTENVKYGRHRALLETWMGRIAPTLRLKDPYAQKMSRPETAGRFLTLYKVFPPQTGGEDL